MRRYLIAGNWKMHMTGPDTRTLIRELDQSIGRNPRVDVLVCPPFTALAAAREATASTAIGLGAQNVHWEDKGAFTGEVSCDMLLDCGCTHVIIGHSERRQLFSEDDSTVNRKLTKVLTTELIPILCVGETLQQREDGTTEKAILDQLEAGLKGLTPQETSRMIVAYEPVWAIGTGRTATPAIAQEVHAAVRDWFDRIQGSEVAANIRILYGGSVNPGNVSGLMAEPDIDGALVGGASLKAESFSQLCSF